MAHLGHRQKLLQRVLLYIIVCIVTLGGLSSCKRRSKGDSSLAGGMENVRFEGFSDYRLAFINSPKLGFNPNTDVLNPSAQELVDEQIANSMRRAILLSLLPLAKVMTQNAVSFKEQELTNALMSCASSAAKVLQESFLNNLSTIDIAEPQEAWLIPWTDKQDNRFYQAEKISVSPVQLVNVVGVTASNPAFNRKLTENIKKMIASRYQKSKDPAFLLAMHSILSLQKNQHRMEIRILLGLNPSERPFVKDHPEVKFQKMVVPTNPEHPTAAVFRFFVDLEPNPKAPYLVVEFGEFRGVEEGLFALVPENQHIVAPRLEGTVNKARVSWVAVSFAFKQFYFDLVTLEVGGLNTAVSPGFQIAGTRWTTGALQVESVNKSFQDEINKTIADEVEKQKGKANESLMNGGIDPQLLQKVFGLVFSNK